MSALSIRRGAVAIAVCCLAGAVAYAQPEAEQGSGERPAHGFAPPSDEAPPPAGAAEGATAAGHPGEGHPGGHAEHHIDPSRFFNFFDISYGGKDMTGGSYGDGAMTDPKTGAVLSEEEPKSAPFIFMVLNFAILLGLLAWKGGPVARKLAVDRHDQIKTALDEAAKLRKQAADKLAEYEARLRQADAEIKKLVEGMRTDADADKQRILAAAEHQAAQMKRDAELRIAAEIEAARAALTREVTAAAAAATERLLREQMTAGDQQKLVAGFIGDLQATSSKEAR